MTHFEVRLLWWMFAICVIVPLYLISPSFSSEFLEFVVIGYLIGMTAWRM